MREIADQRRTNSLSPGMQRHHTRLNEVFAGAHVQPRREAIQAQRDGKSYVYFIGGTEGPVKIGVTIAPLERLRAMQLHSPIHLELLAKVEGQLSEERAYHARYAAHRLHGEWFERCPEIEAEIARLSL